MYFKKVGGRWVAGILDIDHILPYTELLGAAAPETAVSHDWMRNIAENPQVGPARLEAIASAAYTAG